MQNRFTSVVANLQTSSENLAASRSRIRDTDFAKETAELTRTQILQQAGTAMLAQANQVPQNVLSLLRWRTRRSVHDVELFIALLVDVGALTAQLYLSGGIGNPFVFLYLLQIAVGAMLLRGGYIWSIVVVASACVMLLSQHSQPLPLATNVHDGWASPYVLGLLVCFMLNAILVVIFITRISHNLRRRDARLAAVRQRVAELSGSFLAAVNNGAKAFGIEVVDVRIKRINLPEDSNILTTVYSRMRTERTQVANQLRAEGVEQSETIRSEADRQRVVTLAEAERDAQKLRGEGDARAAEIAAAAYGGDPEFYAFYRSLEAYRNSMADGQTVLVLDPDSEFLRYFGSDKR